MKMIVDRGPVQLELVGINGNAYSLMGAFKGAARKQGWTSDDIDKVLEEAKSGDYDHLLQTLVAHTEAPDESN